MERGDTIEAAPPAERPGPRRTPGTAGVATEGASSASDPARPLESSLGLDELVGTTSLRRILLAVGGLALLSAAMFAVIHVIGVDRIRSTVEAAGPWGPLVYIVLKVATMVIAPLSSAPLRMSAGAIFGFWEGVLLTVVGGVLGGSANFWISRLIGRRLVARCVGASGMDAVDRLVGRLGDWRALAFARVFLAPAWDFVSYAAGFTRIRFGSYLLVAIVGDVIPTILFVGLGTSLVEDPRLVVGALAGFVLLYALLPVVRRLTPNTLTDSTRPSRSEP